MILFNAAAIESAVCSRKIPKISDDLLLKVINGDSDSLKKLYEETSSAVFGYALSILKDKYSAEDVMQDTYVRIFGIKSTYTPRQKPMAWLLTVTRNLCMMKFREKTHSDIENSANQIPSETPNSQYDDKLLVNALLEKLTEQEREIVILHAMTGLKHREIAQLTDIPLSTVLSKYSRAIGKLREFVKEEK